MKRIITIIMIIFSIGMIHSYDFELYADNSRAKSSTCELRYDNFNKSLSFEKEHTRRTIKKEIDSNLSLVCTGPLTVIRFKLYDDDNNLIYSEQVKAKKHYSYTINVKKLELEFSEDNTCTINNGAESKEYNIKRNQDIDLEISNFFSISCESSLEESTIRLYDRSNYNLKYKVFEENEKSFTLNLDDPIKNYKHKVELYLRPYDSKDDFKCKTLNDGEKIEFTNIDKKLMMSKTFYTDNRFKLDCDYKFKEIQIFTEDSYLMKELNSFKFSNVSNINILLNISQNKKIEIKKEKPKTNSKPIAAKVNKTIKVTTPNKSKVKPVENKTIINFKPVEKTEIKEKEEVGFFKSIWNWIFN